MEDTIDINIVVKVQGAPVVNTASLREQSGNMVAIEIDMTSKYCQVGGRIISDGEPPCILIEANEATLYTEEGISKDEMTAIELPDYIGWEVFCAECSRYTARICLIKN